MKTIPCCLFFTALSVLSADISASNDSEATTRSQSFDQSNIDWTVEGAGSARSGTRFAGGAKSGETGIQPSIGTRYMNADTEMGAFDLSTPFSATGKLVWRLNGNPNTFRGIHFGYFNQADFSTFVGISFHGDAGARAFLIEEPERGNIKLVKNVTLGRLKAGTRENPEMARPHAFTIRWDPNGGFDGAGSLFTQLEGVGTATIELAREERASFTSALDAFGFLVPDGAHANGSQFFVDDLEYTIGSNKLAGEMAFRQASTLKARGQAMEPRSGNQPIGAPARFGVARPQPGNMPVPDRAYFFTPDLPLEDPNTPLENYDSPSLTNHWMFIQASANPFMDQGILNTEDIFLGGQGPFPGTATVSYAGLTKDFHQPLIVRIDGEALVPDEPVADWFPDKIVRRASRDGLDFVGTVQLAPQSYAVLKRLEVRNNGRETKTFTVDLVFSPGSGTFGTVEKPDRAIAVASETIYEFADITLKPGETAQLRAALTYRETTNRLDHYLTHFEDQSKGAEVYWEEVIADAYDPAPGEWLSGGVPAFHTEQTQTQRLYNFGIMTALMTMFNSPETRTADSNLYVVAMPEAPYDDQVVLWDNGYAMPIITIMDPDAARNTLRLWFETCVEEGLPILNSFPFNTDGKYLLSPHNAFSASASQLVISLYTFLHMTGEWDFLEEEIEGKTVMDYLRTIDHDFDRRPQWNGLAHYGNEHNLFDPGTVKGYVHWVAAPNAGAVYIRNVRAELEEMLGNEEKAEELRASADAIAQALVDNLYNEAPEHQGTWKQRHEDGSVSQLRHAWDFALTGSFITEHLSEERQQQMVDWLFERIVNLDSDDIWVISQDRRDGNNGTHQMEHNGRGAYPAWPYHYAWALHQMGYDEKMIDLLQLIDGITVMGPLGQGNLPDGRRCRSNWIDIAGASMASYIIYLLFDQMPMPGEAIDPDPFLENFDPDAKLSGLRYRGDVIEVTDAD